MRIGGAVPFGSLPIPIPLASGEWAFLPPGQWIINTGPSTQVQWWDQQIQNWRVLIPVSTAGQISVDGFNFRVVNITGAISIASFTAGSGATNGIGQAATGVTAAVSAPGANGRQAFIFPIVGGSVNPTITLSTTPGPGLFTAGAGLLVPPLLICSPPPLGGITATFVCTIAAGAISTITNVNPGAGYVAPPTITVIPQMAYYVPQIPPSPGVAATIGGSNFPPGNYIWPSFQWGNSGVFTTLPIVQPAATLTGSGTLTGVTVLDAGALYSGTPTATVTGAGAATVTLNAVTAAANDTVYIQPAVNE